MLRLVTITGADDATSIQEMREITNEFPFIEWGILISSHYGQRCPSMKWVQALVEERGRPGAKMNLSLHVCGMHLRKLTVGETPFALALDWAYCGFDRIQLNFHAVPQGDVGEQILSGICKASAEWDPEVIFQADGVNEALIRPTARRFRCSYLFDRSHGAGVVPSEWPEFDKAFPCGWAGGLGPDNLASELVRIQEKACPLTDYWVDMETKVRTGANLDLAKVRKCLQICREFGVRN